MWGKIRLVGKQSTGVKVYDGHTPDARIGLRINSTLLYMDSKDTVEHLYGQWALAGLQAKELPTRSSIKLVETDPRISDMALTLSFSDKPATGGGLRKGRNASYLDIRLGPLAIEVMDRESFESCMKGWDAALEESRTAFSPAHELVSPAALALSFEKPFTQSA